MGRGNFAERSQDSTGASSPGTPGATTQTAWFVSSAGNNGASGLTAGTAILDLDELDRRLAGRPVTVATVITVLTDLPSAGKIGLLRLVTGQGGTILLKGTATNFFTSGAPGITAHTNINRATNTPNNFTDANMAAATFTAAGFTSKRVKVTPAVGSPYQAWVAKDTAAKSGRVSAWIAVETTFPYALFYVPQNAANGDPYVIQTLTSIAQLRLEMAVINSDPFTSPRIVVQDLQFASLTSVVTSFAPLTIAYVGCDLVSGTYSGSFSAWGCRGAGYVSNVDTIESILSSCFFEMTTATGGFVQVKGEVIDGDTLLQYDAGGTAAVVTNLAQLTTLGCFDSPDDGITINCPAVESVITIIGSNGLYGAGNTGVGINVTNLSSLHYGTKPTLTGALGDTRIGGAITAYGAIPFTNAAELAAIRLKV